MNVKLLLDENLSPQIAEVLRMEDGLDAVHVRDRGLLEAGDRVVLELARARELHPGIILVEDGALLRDEQLRVVRAAVAVLQGQCDLVNRVLRIWLDGTTVLEDVPAR